jgi:hypothetical protein
MQQHQQALEAVYRRLVELRADTEIYEPSAIRYWLAQGWTPDRIIREILSLPIPEPDDNPTHV